MGPAKVAGALTAISLPVFAREARRARDRRRFWMLVAALQLKLLGALTRYYVAYRTYEGRADAESYHRGGARIARGDYADVGYRAYEGGADAEGYHRGGARIARGDYARTLNPRFSAFVGSNFIRQATGTVYRVIGPSRLGGFLAFSWLAFWGLYLFDRAFETAVPGGRSPDYSRLVLFWPSLLFWPSSIGKEAWMVFSLGTGTFGAARGLADRPRRILGLDVAGIWLAGRVRPHVASLLGLSVAGAYLARGRRARGLAIGAFAVGQALQANRYLRLSGIRTEEGPRAALEQTAKRTSKLGGSKFTPPIVRSPAQLPLVPLTVLFRPHLLEAHNAQALVAALESSLLLGVTLARGRRSLAALSEARQVPFVGLALGYCVLFCAAFAGIANFGVLARQRVQLLPFYLVLLSAPPRRRRRAFRLPRP